MFGQYVSLEITFCCCFIPAILTSKCFTFMYGLCVFVETSLSPFRVNFYSQCWHRNIFPLCIDWMCDLRLPLSVYWSQCWHWKVLPSCIDCMCLLRLPLFAYFSSQCWHWYILPPCIDCMCLLRLTLFANFCSQCWQCVNWKYPLLLLYNHTIDIYIFYPHVLTRCFG